MEKKTFDAIDGTMPANQTVETSAPRPQESPATSKQGGLSKAPLAPPTTTAVVAGSDSLPSAAFKASFTRDFKSVEDKDRAKYVASLCKVLDIPTPLNPFYFLDMNGKTLLYSGIEAAQLLAESKKLSVEVRKKSLDEKTGLYTVEVRVTGPSGRFCDNEGVIYIGGQSGKDRANAQMKAITKAQRRAILSYCGLSMTDDSDIQEGDYGRPYNPLAERTAEIIDQRRLETAQDSDQRIVDRTPAPIDSETKAARGELFKLMFAGTTPLFASMKDGNKWLQMAMQKNFDELTVDECTEAFIRLEEDQEPLADAGEEPCEQPV